VKRRAVLIAALAAACGCATLPTCPAKGGTPWLELETSHFLLRTNYGESDARELLLTLEETRAALLATVWPNTPDPPIQTRVIAVDSVKESIAYFPDRAVSITYPLPPFPPTAVLGPRWRPHGFGVLALQLAEELSSHSLPLQPTWYSLGIGTFVETMTYDRSSQTVTIGEPPIGPFIATRQNTIPASLLISLEGPPPEKKSDSFQGYSWFLFRYLIDSDPAGLARFQDLIRAMVPAEEAWRRAFPTLTYERVDKALSEYKSIRTFSTLQGHVVPPPYTVKVRRLPDATVHAQRAFLLYGRNGIEPRSGRDFRAELDEAFAEDRNDIEALALAFRLAEGAAERRGLAQRAIAAHPDSGLAAVMLADELDERDPAARAALVHALISAPRSGELMWRLARAEAALGNWPPARRFAEQAIRMGGSKNRPLLHIYAEALARTGSCAESSYVMERIQQQVTGAEGVQADARGRELAELCRQTPPAAP
jgi:hypothetical protein